MKIQPSTVAKIHFFGSDDGGTDHLPADHLATNVRLPHSDRSWTLLMDFWEEPGFDEVVRASVEFLADDAPHGELVKGTRFDVLEVGERIAAGEIVIDAIEPEDEGESYVDGDLVGPVRRVQREEAA